MSNYVTEERKIKIIKSNQMFINAIKFGWFIVDSFYDLLINDIGL